jgi:hypothetical protein
MAILDDSNEFCGGVVFSEYRDYDCQLSCAAETPLAWKPSVLRAVFDYVFNQLTCVRCTALTKKSNRRARAFLEGLGFELEGRIRRGYDGVKDALIYGLLREDCVYIQEVIGGTLEADDKATRTGKADELQPVAMGTEQDRTDKPSGNITPPVSEGSVQTLDFW